MRISRSKRFGKQFKKMSEKTQQQFFKRLELFLSDRTHPYLKVHQLSGKYRGYGSFNVNSDIRAVFKEGHEEIIFITIGSHSQLYE